MYASAHPQEVRRLVLLDALIPGLGYEAALDSSHGTRFWFTPFNMVPDIPEALLAGRERIYLDYFYKELTYNPAAISEEDIAEYLRTYTAPGAMRAFFSVLPQLRRGHAAGTGVRQAQAADAGISIGW